MVKFFKERCNLCFVSGFSVKMDDNKPALDLLSAWYTLAQLKPNLVLEHLTINMIYILGVKIKKS